MDGKLKDTTILGQSGPWSYGVEKGDSICQKFRCSLESYCCGPVKGPEERHELGIT